MPSIGSMAVNISANTSQFSKGLDKVEKQAAGFGKTIAGIGAAIGGALAIKSLVDFAKEQADIIDKTAKLSDTLGLSTEALLTFQHAADLSGASSDELATGLKKMAKFAEESAVPLSQQAALLNELGINAQMFSGLGVEEQFLAMADAIAALPAGGAQVKAAMEVFGKGGAALIPTLAQGADAIKAIGKDMAARGLLFSREEANRVERANDAFTKMKRTITAIVQQMVIEFAPVVENVVEAFRKWADKSGGFKEIFKGLAQEAAEIAANMLEWIGELRLLLKDWQVTASQSKGFAKGFVAAAAGMPMAGVSPGTGGAMSANNPFAQQITAMRLMAAGLSAGTNTHGGSKGWTWGLDLTKILQHQTDEMIKAMKEWDVALGKSIDAVMAGGSELDKFHKAVDTAQMVIDGLGPMALGMTDRFLMDAFTALEKSLTQSQDIGGPQSLVKDSREALDAIRKFERDLMQGNETQEERLRRVLEESLKVERDALREAREMRREFMKQRVITVN